jgi:hypothetical protein
VGIHGRASKTHGGSDVHHIRVHRRIRRADVDRKRTNFRACVLGSAVARVQTGLSTSTQGVLHPAAAVIAVLRASTALPYT